MSSSRRTFWPWTASVIALVAAPCIARPPQAGPTAPRPSAARRPAPPKEPSPVVSQPTATPVVAGKSSPDNDAPPDASTPEGLALALSDVLQDAIPRHYEKRKNWDHTKRITTGLRSEGNFFEFNIKRRKKEVKHGNWYHYRVEMVEPEERLQVRIEHLRSLSPGRIGFTMYVSSPLEGWAQARVYNRGVHFITLTAEGHTTLHIWIDCEISLSLNPAALFSEVEVTPVVTDARLDLADFELERISKASGPLVEELGKGLRYVILEELEGPALVAKLNRAIEKKRDRLKLSPGKLLKLPTPESASPPPAAVE